jgi:centrin-1
MEDPEFLRKVFRLMNDETVVDTFAIFDADGSGTIDAKELEALVSMLVPNPHPTLVREIAKELDLDSDGEIDLWEFCVHMQKRQEGLTRAEMDNELDAAFDLFHPDDRGMVDLEELHRVMQDEFTGCPLDDAEFNSLVDSLDQRCRISSTGPLRSGGKIPLRDLRQHPCFTAEVGLGASTAKASDGGDD